MWQDKQMCDRVEAVNENKRLELAAVSDSLSSMSGNTDEANVAINMNIGNNVSALWTPVTDQSVDEVGQLRAHGGEAEPEMYQRSAAQVEEVSNIPIVRPAIAPAHIDSKFATIDWCPNEPGTQTENTLMIDDGIGRVGARPRILGQVVQSGIISAAKQCHFSGIGVRGPHGIKQVYTVNVLSGQTLHAVPIAIFHLPNTEYITYVRMFRLLKELVSNVTGNNMIMESITIDANVGIDRAATNTWPDITIYYCVGNFQRTVFQRIKSHWDDDNIRKSARLLFVLPFLPPSDVIKVFVSLGWHPALHDILSEWFEPCFVGAVVHGVRQQPKFAIKKWSVHTRVLYGHPMGLYAFHGMNSPM